MLSNNGELFVLARSPDQLTERHQRNGMLESPRLNLTDGLLWCRLGDMNKKEALNGLLRMKGRFVLNQSPKVFADKRTKRNRTRSDKKRRALDEQE